MEAEAAEPFDNNANNQTCLVEKPSQGNEQTLPVILIQEDKATNNRDPEDQTDTRGTELLKASQWVKCIIKEDFSQLKEEVFNVFKETDTSSSSHAENKPSPSTLNLLKEDLSQFKEDVTSIFSSPKETKCTDPKTSRSAENSINRLSFLNFKDDLFNVFRMGFSKEKDNRDATVQSDSSNTFNETAKRTDKPFMQTLFRRDQKISQKAENTVKLEKTFSETTKEQVDDGFRENLSEHKEETVNTLKPGNNMADRLNKEEDSEVDVTVNSDEQKTSQFETQQSKETSSTPQAAKQRCESEEWSDSNTVWSAEDERITKEEEKQDEKPEEDEEKEQQQQMKPPEIVLWEPLSSGSNLLSPRNLDKDDMRTRPGRDFWALKNFACYLTLDPNTANSELRLTDRNRKATRVWPDHRRWEHPDQFELCPQVLCREGLLDSVYWEVEWSGGADIGVAYNGISRKGVPASCLLGQGDGSWSLECSEGAYTPCHNNNRFRSSSPQPFAHRVGVYLNWSAGCLSFYCVSRDTMVHLHTFTTTFTQPLYPCFWLWAYDGSVLLNQVELDWERLLQ
ncbi:uncharacterized protein ACO6RY_19058 [Pungitius sinensis]